MRIVVTATLAVLLLAACAHTERRLLGEDLQTPQLANNWSNGHSRHRMAKVQWLMQPEKIAL